MTKSKTQGVIRAKIENMLGQLTRAHEDMLNGKIAHRTYNGVLYEIASDLTRLAVSGKIPGVPATPRSTKMREGQGGDDFSAAKESFIAP